MELSVALAMPSGPDDEAVGSVANGIRFQGEEVIRCRHVFQRLGIHHQRCLSGSDLECQLLGKEVMVQDVGIHACIGSHFFALELIPFGRQGSLRSFIDQC